MTNTRIDRTTSRRNTNKNDSHQQMVRFFQSIHTVNIPHPIPRYCDRIKIVNTGTTTDTPLMRQTLDSLLPTDLCVTIHESAQKGFLHTFLCILDEQFITDYLKIKMYSPAQIYWINKAIKALTLIALGAAFGKTVSTPLFTILIANTTGVNESCASYITSAGFFTYDLITKKNLAAEHDITTATLIYCAGLAAGVLGNLAAKLVYKYGPLLIQNNLFAAKEKEIVLQMEAIEEPQPERPMKRRMSV